MLRLKSSLIQAFLEPLWENDSIFTYAKEGANISSPPCQRSECCHLKRKRAVQALNSCLHCLIVPHLTHKSLWLSPSLIHYHSNALLLHIERKLLSINRTNKQFKQETRDWGCYLCLSSVSSLLWVMTASAARVVKASLLPRDVSTDRIESLGTYSLAYINILVHSVEGY